MDGKRALKYGLRDIFSSLLGIRKSDTLRNQEFWALKNIDLEVRRGECLGILGPNGSGKSSLLKIISGILKPDIGEVTTYGNVESMTRMNAGFNAELTGRENIYIRTKLFGYSSKESKKVTEEIIEFSGLEEFINSPFKFYSSGMKARLSFSISTLFKPDVLLIDEVLAVGDAKFKVKCFEKIDEMVRSSAVIYVSHSLGHISRLCDKTIYLRRGKIQMQGNTQEVIKQYLTDQIGLIQRRRKKGSFRPERQKVSFWIGRERIPKEATLNYGDRVTVKIVPQDIPEGSSFIVQLIDSNDTMISDWNSKRSGIYYKPNTRLICDLGSLELCPGIYMARVMVLGPSEDHVSLSQPLFFTMDGDYYTYPPFQPQGEWRIKGG